jgi:hypothetical protein
VAESYYFILGIEPDASMDEIKSAYRRKAMELHPDHYEGSSKPFRDVQEAYEALCDPERRRSHDTDLAREKPARFAPWNASCEPLTSRRCPVEPLVPREPATGWQEPPLGSSHSFPYRDSLNRVWDELDARFWPPGRTRDEGQVVIPLTRAQALRGGRVRVWIAVSARCPACQGYGGAGFYECWECSGTGSVVEQRPAWIDYPAGVSSRTVARVSLAPLGIPNAYLAVRFVVRG